MMISLVTSSYSLVTSSSKTSEYTNEDEDQGLGIRDERLGTNLKIPEDQGLGRRDERLGTKKT